MALVVACVALVLSLTSLALTVRRPRQKPDPVKFVPCRRIEMPGGGVVDLGSDVDWTAEQAAKFREALAKPLTVLHDPTVDVCPNPVEISSLGSWTPEYVCGCQTAGDR